MKQESVYLLSAGNGKVGRVHLFGLPAVDSCPGASDVCLTHCYARSGRFRTPAVRDRLRRSWEASRQPLFADRLVLEVRLRRARVVRIHDSGDFHAEAYIRDWARVAGCCPPVRFYAYTRSWRLPGLRRVLEQELAPLPNVRLWYSADRATGVPAGVPPGVRVAYLQADAADRVPPGADLVFRVRRLRRQPARRVSLALVCPTEQGAGHRTTCQQCARCWR